ncbi:MFS transporter [Acutalibacter muris]|uniref:MFS transporter n=1 Tax=Acutalibacter muris TaxID=1796620 RepID=A0A1Z2XMV2_9FIRM|nr:MFS transporter [Acutalibacter muris]ANU53558.1 MFS transporter [Hungateiclostridiaceae bacterium KB18]ASB39766.1 MFS transporter [Acutalibacter muris]QQR29058.1 MFS transporter [Acutalibacter muris]
MFTKLFSRRLWSRDFILIVLVCTIASYTNSTFMTLLPVYVLDLGGTNAMTGMMMTGLTVVGMFTRIIAAPLFDRVGRKKMLVLGAGLYAVNALLFCFTKDLNMLFALRVLQGFTQGVFFPVPHIIAADIPPKICW